MEVVLELIMAIISLVAVGVFFVCMIGVVTAICGLPIAAIYCIYLLITQQPIVGLELSLISFCSGMVIITISNIINYAKRKD